MDTVLDECNLIGAGTHPLILHLLEESAQDLRQAGFGSGLIDGVLAG